MTAVGKKERGSKLLWGVFSVFLLCYFAKWLDLAVHTPVWMDEVLTLWTVRLSSASQIYYALAHGAQFSPPSFHWLLFYFAKIAGGSYLALRIPSIAAVLLTGLCSFVIFRRYLGLAPAMFACCLLLETIRSYAVTIRPYALITACFAVALLLLDDYNRRPAPWRCAVIALLLSFAISLHIYSILFIPCFGVAELIRSLRMRTFRLSIWIALGVAGASTLLWLPLIRDLAQYLGGYVNSPEYWGKPVLSKLIGTYSDLLFSGSSNILPILAAIAVIPMARLFGVKSSFPEEDSGARLTDFWTLMLGSALLPLIVYIFSVLVTKTFHPRYTVAGVIGMTAVVAGAFSGMPLFRRVVPLIILLTAALTLTHRVHYFGEFDRAAVFQNLPGPYPIVVADGVQFFPLVESAPAEIRSRLVYLTLPADVQAPDPWDGHQIEMWKAINPRLPVESMSAFLVANPKFYVLDTRSSDDTPATYLLGNHLVELTSQANGVSIFKSRSSPVANDW